MVELMEIKIAVFYNNKVYMLKFPPKPINKLISYVRIVVLVNIFCLIIKTLGLNSQNTILGKYKEKIIEACEDFTANDYKFFDFIFKNTIIDSEHSGYGQSWKIFNTIDSQK